MAFPGLRFGGCIARAKAEGQDFTFFNLYFNLEGSNFALNIFSAQNIAGGTETH